MTFKLLRERLCCGSERGGVIAEGAIALFILVLFTSGAVEIYSFGQAHLDLTYAAKQAAQVAFAYQRSSIPSAFGAPAGLVPTEAQAENCVSLPDNAKPNYCGSILVRYRARQSLAEINTSIDFNTLRITEKVSPQTITVFIAAHYDNQTPLFDNYVFNVQESAKGPVP